MAVTPGQEEALAPKPPTVSSASSLDTSLSGYIDGEKFSSSSTQQPFLAQANRGGHVGATHTSSSHNFGYSRSPTMSSNGLPSSISLVTRGSGLQISPSTGVVVPSAVPSTNTVPEFLYQLTKMLTDHNRDVIEWSNGTIEVHSPHKLQTNVLNRYFRHSKFASFQRQLNYFGFRKLAGKGKMAPCSYVNDATTNDLGSLLLIKRKTGNEPKAKGGKKRERGDGLETQGSAKHATHDTPVNPVLAGILYKSASESAGSLHTSTVASPRSKQSQQALARVAVGKGIRHSFSMPQSKDSVAVRPTATPNPLTAGSPVQDSLSQLQSNYKNSLQDLAAQEKSTALPDSTVSSRQPSSSLNPYVPGSMRRDDSLVDLAMIPMIDGGTQENMFASNGLTFVDFPWQDPNAPQI